MKNQTGSTLTKVAREASLKHVQAFMRSNEMANKIQEVKAAHIERYIEAQKEAGVSDRTLQNRMSHIRQELSAIGRDKLATSDRLSTQALGIGGASRDGTHRALSETQYVQALEQARGLNPGFAACLELQRELGLRQSEAIQSTQSLKSWERALELGERVRVLHGTKGGRSRDSLPNNPELALKAVKTAIEASKLNGGYLVQSKTLEGARRSYGRLCNEVGLKGEHASHALRCSYALLNFMAVPFPVDRAGRLAHCSLDSVRHHLKQALASTALACPESA
jgi:site-specific recombinase XerC